MRGGVNDAAVICDKLPRMMSPNLLGYGMKTRDG